MVFPFNDTFWCDCVRYLHMHGNDKDIIIAPSEFAEVLPNRVISYPEAPEIISVPWVIIHKGMLSVFDPLIVKQVIDNYSLVYANEVFVGNVSDLL